MTSKPFNPLDKLNLADSIQRQVLQASVHALADDEARKLARGSGVYVLYYTGEFDEYQEIAARNIDARWEQPIYVGKAIPPGGRIGGLRQAERAVGALRNRLTRHARSVAEVTNLDVRDFHYKSLVVDDVWIPLGENMLIETFRPLWNTVLSGFGSNPTGGPRSAQASSRWDTLHPGRAGAGTSSGREVEHVKAIVREYARGLGE